MLDYERSKHGGLNMGTIFIITLAFIMGSLITLLFIDKKVIKNIRKPKNKVHFYIARDKNGSLWLYIGKPIRCDTTFKSLYVIYPDFQYFGLNKNDYTNLKWEDEPLEVFVNIKDTKD